MKGLNSLLDKTDNDKLKGIQEKLNGVVEKAKEGDIGGAIQSGTEGSKLEEFGGLSSQVVKKVKEGEPPRERKVVTNVRRIIADIGKKGRIFSYNKFNF